MAASVSLSLHGLDGVPDTGDPGCRGLLPGECDGGVGRADEAVAQAAHLLFRGVAGRGRLPGGDRGGAPGGAGGRLGADVLPRVSGGQLRGAGAHPGLGALSAGHRCGPLPAGQDPPQVSV